MAKNENGTIPLSPEPANAVREVDIDFSDALTISATRSTQQVDFALDAQSERPPATQSINHVALPRGYALQEYTIEAVLGVGGFGITYLAQDNNLQRRVALKEYLPNDLAIRAGGQTVVPRTDSDSHGYAVGLDRFLAESRVLATFGHHNIVRVTRFFEANQTAYMVMDYEQGESLRSWVESHGPVDEATAMRMFLPLLDGLETVHKGGVVHRDIKPANLYVRDSDASLVLLDFGAARQTTGASSKSLTSIITPGYAPFEQYHTRGAQGPWTDLYALGGVLYWLVTGQKPIEAPSRVRDDPLVPAVVAGAGRFSAAFLQAIDWALTVDEGQRPHSVADFRSVLTGASAVPARKTAAVAASAAKAPVPAKAPYLKYAMAGGAVTLVAILTLVLLMKPGNRPTAEPVAANPAEAVVPAKADTPATKNGEPAASAKAKTRTATAKSTPARTVPPAAKGATVAPAAVSTQAASAAAGPTALLTFQIVPVGETAELVIDDRTIGRLPQIKEYRLPAGKHKVEVYGNKLPRVYHYWVNLEPNEKKNIWVRFADN